MQFSTQSTTLFSLNLLLFCRGVFLPIGSSPSFILLFFFFSFQEGNRIVDGGGRLHREKGSNTHTHTHGHTVTEAPVVKELLIRERKNQKGTMKKRQSEWEGEEKNKRGKESRGHFFFYSQSLYTHPTTPTKIFFYSDQQLRSWKYTTKYPWMVFA